MQQSGAAKQVQEAKISIKRSTNVSDDSLLRFDIGLFDLLADGMYFNPSPQVGWCVGERKRDLPGEIRTDFRLSSSYLVDWDFY